MIHRDKEDSLGVPKVNVALSTHAIDLLIAISALCCAITAMLGGAAPS
jgi:hypothetical protein